MSTPSIQTLITQAQQVLNLKSSNEIRATLAAVLANANVGTPLNPNLTTQQLWDEFYEIVRQPSDDIMSIITDQMMRMVFSPPAPGGAGADKQVIFNDGGVLAGDPDLIFNKALNKLVANNIETAAGLLVGTSATITGDLTVDTNVLKVDTTLNRVGIGTASPIAGSSLDVRGAVGTGTDIQSLTLIDTSALAINNGGGLSFGYVFESPNTVIGRAGYIKTIKENATDGNYASAMVFGVTANGASTAERYRIGSDGTSTWSVAGTTAMTLNSTGLGIGTTTPDIFGRFYTRSIGFNSTGSTVLQINGTSYGGLDLGAAGVRTFSLTSSATEAGITTATNIPINFNINGATKMTLNTAGNLAFVNGQGIDFSAKTPDGSGTVGSEVLNDYEEGTFTPTIIGATTAGVGTYTTQAGYYTKVGNLVTASVFLGWTAHTGTGNMYFAGLPFAASSSASYHSAASISYVNNIALTASNVLTLFITPGASSLEASQYPVGGGGVTNVPVDVSGNIIYTVTYRV